MFRPALRSSVQLIQRRTLITRASTPTLNVLKTHGTSPAFKPLNLQPHRRFLSQEAKAQITKAVKSTPVVLFMKGTPDAPQCGFSRAVVQILELHGVPAEKLQTFNVLEDAELRTGIKEFSEWPTIPQIYINGEFVGGCDILIGMHQSGELENLLENNNIIPKVAESDAKPAAGTSSTA